MAMCDLDQRLTDGRLPVQDRGATQAPTVVFCHGTPASRLLHERWLAASLAPCDAPGLDWFAGMAETNVQRSKLALAGREALQPVLGQSAQALVAADPAQLIALSVPLLSRPDQAVLDSELGMPSMACLVRLRVWQGKPQSKMSALGGREPAEGS